MELDFHDQSLQRSALYFLSDPSTVYFCDHLSHCLDGSHVRFANL